MGNRNSKKSKKSENSENSVNSSNSANSSNSGRKLTELKDPATIDYYEPYALKELNDKRIIYFTLKGNQIIVMTKKLNGSNDDIFIPIEYGVVESIIQLKNNIVIYGTSRGLIDIISLQKDSYESKQKIINENNGVVKLVELNNLNFASIMKNNDIILLEKKRNQYEITNKINYKSNIYFTSGIESSINNQLLITTPSIFIFVDIYKKKILKEIKVNEGKKNEDKGREDISVFTENCLRYNDIIIVAGIIQFFLIDCKKQSIIKKVNIHDNNYPCCTLTRFVGDSFVTGSGFGELAQYKLNKNGNDLEFIDKGGLYLDRVTTCVYSECGRLIIGEYNGLVILSFY